MDYWKNFSWFVCAQMDYWKNFSWFVCAQMDYWKNFSWFVCAQMDYWKNISWFVCAQMDCGKNFSWFVCAQMDCWKNISWFGFCTNRVFEKMQLIYFNSLCDGLFGSRVVIYFLHRFAGFVPELPNSYAFVIFIFAIVKLLAVFIINAPFAISEAFFEVSFAP